MASQEQASALESWFKSNGGYLHPNITIRAGLPNGCHPSSGIHYCATGPISPNTILASAPASLSLSYLNAAFDDTFIVFLQIRRLLPIEATGFWYLAVQYVNRERSYWKPYLESLPSSSSHFTQPLWFEHPDDIAQLEGTPVWQEITERKKIYQQYYDVGFSILQKSGSDVRPYTWDLFRWAVTMFSSRAFHARTLYPPKPETAETWSTYKWTDLRERTEVRMPWPGISSANLDFPVLWPGLDAANHDSDVHMDWRSPDGQLRFTLDESAAGLETGDEIHNNYGPKGNGELLLGYGFCIEGNIHDTIALKLKEPSQPLQLELKHARPLFFHQIGEWNSEAGTFYFRRPRAFEEHDPELWDIFYDIPSKLLELLLYTIHEKQGLPFMPIEKPYDYLTASSSPGKTYAPRLCRMLLDFLQSKLAILESIQPPSNLGEPSLKSIHAAIYRRSQRDIHAGYVNNFTNLVRSLRWTHDVTDRQRRPAGVALLDLKSFHNLLFSHEIINDEFLVGVESITNSRDLDVLWVSGWDDELWLLLICFAVMSPNLTLPRNMWLRQALQSFETAMYARVFPQSGAMDVEDTTVPGWEDAQPLPAEEEELIDGLMAHVECASGFFYSRSVWLYRTWSKPRLWAVSLHMHHFNCFDLQTTVPESAAEALRNQGSTNSSLQARTRCYLQLDFGTQEE